MGVLGVRFLRASEWAAAGGGGTGNRGRAGCQTSLITDKLAGGCHLWPADGGHRYGNRCAVKERQPSCRAGQAWLAVLSGVESGWSRLNVWTLHACALDY